MLDVLIYIGFICFVIYLLDQQLHFAKHIIPTIEKIWKIIYDFSKSLWINIVKWSK